MTRECTNWSAIIAKIVLGGVLATVLTFSACVELPEEEELPAPELIFPDHGATDVTINALTLRWNPVPAATAFYLQMNHSGSFPEFPQDTYTIYDTKAEFSSLPAATTFYWRVCYSAGIGSTVSNWSETRSFTTIALQVPQPLDPTSGATVANNEVELIWVYVPGVQFYEVEVSNSSTFSQIIHHGKYLVETVDRASNLQNGTQYFWRVRSLHSGAHSEWSEVQSFTVSF